MRQEQGGKRTVDAKAMPAARSRGGKSSHEAKMDFAPTAKNNGGRRAIGANQAVAAEGEGMSAIPTAEPVPTEPDVSSLVSQIRELSRRQLHFEKAKNRLRQANLDFIARFLRASGAISGDATKEQAFAAAAKQLKALIEEKEHGLDDIAEDVLVLEHLAEKPEQMEQAYEKEIIGLVELLEKSGRRYEDIERGDVGRIQKERLRTRRAV